ncbi:MAG: type II toxin-antitoxin system RelE/ParE family toxin [Prevotella sp.]|nr:type II toxin-antitoxin system RelE/ParE family toxin [Prevotella sp.]
MIVEWSEGALHDYDDILGYLIQEFGVRVAQDFQRKLNDRISILTNFPQAGKTEFVGKQSKIDYRSLTCKQYKIVYAQLDDKLVIVSLWNNRRNPAVLRLILKNTA